MKIPRLPVNINEIRAEGPPKRQLEITCHITNSASFDICILDSWIRIKTSNGINLDEGRLFLCMHNKVDPAIIAPNKEGYGAFYISLSTKVLQDIEEKRAGNDIILNFSSRVLVSEVFKLNGKNILGVPYETDFVDRFNNAFSYLIPESEWIKLLKNLKWSDLEILEFPSAKLRSIPNITRALKRFDNAQLCYWRGDWEETMLNCRKVFEAIVQDITGDKNMKKSQQVIESMVADGEKADCLNNLIIELTKFLHLGRHEQLPSVQIRRADAQLALHMTGSLLSYLGDQ